MGHIDIHALQPRERLELLEELWDSLAVHPDQVPLTPAQQVELDARLSDGAPARPWRDVIDEVARRP